MHDMWDKFTLQAGQRITLQANWHADVLHSIEKIICCFVCMCFLFLFFFFVGWWEGEVLLCCERSEGFVFQGCFPQLLSCCFILKMMCLLLFFWIFSTFLSFFFFSCRTFPFVKLLLSLFSPVRDYEMYICLLLLQRTASFLLPCSPKWTWPEFSVPGKLKCACFHLLCYFIGMTFPNCEWYIA